ncbi:sigma-70 family RNA polymerase sigma factor [Edaphobacter sp. 12200R-103]|jgi:RNA polymerase sigma-70 factor (ECF subfamily)|uniref:sigma-70 family RNA polymerase sigma factor n=1 Tax=Edaphobacter sp. 12200R-103 TaxID=2703788 RepID=UPI00138DB40B|nr:sigma-70 family RNA polymerase sigma factor [Edaphobacter sp. 12200R-103]QHS50755.1 sigma-70 family RNA polymerase sigma factor [Edaphobacter sp. 12200R-103]
MQSQDKERDETALIAEILGGKTDAFHELIRPYERSVYLMALSMLRNEADAEDVAQEAFIKAYRNLGRFRSEARFSTWLIAIALNEARARLRRKQPGLTDSIDDQEGPVVPAQLTDWREIPSESLERQEIRSIIRRALEALPLHYREVFMLREIEERNVKETAETLGITIASVKMRLHRARMMLQKQLAPQLTSATETKRRRRFPWF